MDTVFFLGKLGKVKGSRNARTIRMYAQDPRCTVDRSKDPIEALAILFDDLATYGRADVADLAIKHLQQSIGFNENLHCPDQLKPTVDEELLADFQYRAGCFYKVTSYGFKGRPCTSGTYQAVGQSP